MSRKMCIVDVWYSVTRRIWQIANIKKCLYCGGEMVRLKSGLWHFDCTKCDRAWKVGIDQMLHALFDAGNHKYPIDSLIKVRP